MNATTQEQWDTFWFAAGNFVQAMMAIQPEVRGDAWKYNQEKILDALAQMKVIKGQQDDPWFQTEECKTLAK